MAAGIITLPGTALRVPPEHGWVLSADLGHRFTDGLENLLVVHEDGIVIESIEDLGGEGLRNLGAQLTADPKRDGGGFQYLRGFPPREPSLGQLVPALGTTLQPGKRPTESLLGYAVVGRGRLIRKGLRITYRVGRRRYVQEFPSTLIVCTPEAQTPKGECPLPDDV